MAPDGEQPFSGLDDPPFEATVLRMVLGGQLRQLRESADITPERVVYVDYDPIVPAHARALLTSGGAGATDYIHADLRDTPAILGEAAEPLDFSEPVAVTLIAILHAIPDSDDPHAIVARLMERLPSGSHLAISHIAADLIDGETRSGLGNLADKMIQQDFTFRDHEQVARFFAGTDLVAPGLVRVEEWRPVPGDPAGTSGMWAAVGRKR